MLSLLISLIILQAVIFILTIISKDIIIIRILMSFEETFCLPCILNLVHLLSYSRLFLFVSIHL
jgi:hypothetical protein